MLYLNRYIIIISYSTLQMFTVFMFIAFKVKANNFCMWVRFRTQQVTFGLNSTKQSTWSIMSSAKAASSCMIPVWLIWQLVPSVHDQYVSTGKLIHVLHSHSWFIVSSQSQMHWLSSKLVQTCSADPKTPRESLGADAGLSAASLFGFI